MVWLYDLLKDGTLSDNQQYQVESGLLSNPRLGPPIALQQRKDGQRFVPHNNDEQIWRFLAAVSRDVDRLLKERKPDALVLFKDEDYEHNTDDEFARVQGVDARNFVLQTGNLIGYVKKNDYAIKISSRFGDPFLRYIISDADGFLEVENFGGESFGEGYKWLIAYLWQIKLKRAFRLGLPKIYVSSAEKLPAVRGKIDPIDYSLSQATGKYLCNYREHSYRSVAAALFMAAYKIIESHTFSESVRSIYNTFVIANQGTKVSRKEMLAVPHFRNPFYAEYNPLIDLSKQILQQDGADFSEEMDASAFFFDVSMLFEYFVRKLFKRHGINLHAKAERRQEIPSGALRKYRRKLEPDIVFELNGRLFVFDVKYKQYDFKWGVGREDLFQLHTYIGQYANEYAIHGCGFVFPLSEQEWDRNHLDESAGVISDTIYQGKQSIPFRVFFLKIPKACNAEFGKAMQLSCDSFLKSFSSYGAWSEEVLK